MTQDIGGFTWMEIGKTWTKSRNDVQTLLVSDPIFADFRFASREETVTLLDSYFGSSKQPDGTVSGEAAGRFVTDFAMGHTFEQDCAGCSVMVEGKSEPYDKELEMLFWYGTNEELSAPGDKAYLGSLTVKASGDVAVSGRIRKYALSVDASEILMPYDGVDYYCGFVLVSGSPLSAPQDFRVETSSE